MRFKRRQPYWARFWDKTNLPVRKATMRAIAKLGIPGRVELPIVRDHEQEGSGFWIDAFGNVHVRAEIVVTKAEFLAEHPARPNNLPERRVRERRSRHDRRVQIGRGGNDARSGNERRSPKDRRVNWP